jgi:hypothetical protein
MAFEAERRTLVPFFGYIIHSEEQNGTLSYVIKSEGSVSVSHIGVPIFQFGYNSYRYPKGARVYCLPSLVTTKVYILGQIPDPSIAITNETPLPREGEMILNSGDTNNSGILGLGKSQEILIFAGNRKELKFNLSPLSVNLKFLESGFLFEKSSFSLLADSQNSFELKDGKTILQSHLGIKLYGGDGNVFLSGETFGFYQDNWYPKKSLEKNGIIKTSKNINPQFDYSFYIGKSSHNFNAENGYFNYKDGFAVKIGKSNGSSGVLFSITNGDFQSQISQGSFKFSIIQPAGNSFSIKLGPNTKPLSSFILDSSSLKIEIGGTPSIVNSVEMNTSGIILTSLGGNGNIKLDGDVKITGKLIVEKTVLAKDNVYSSSEIYAKASVQNNVVSTSMAIALSTHLHPTSIPGPAVPPKEGT